jgi:methyltransferase (TIGR00027 family)
MASTTARSSLCETVASGIRAARPVCGGLSRRGSSTRRAPICGPWSRPRYLAYRQPLWGSSLRIYEVDHPITQQWKRDRLKAADIAIPSNLTFVPIDFERASIPGALRATDFTFAARTLCSWMGVTQYLTRDALEATFRFVLSLPPSSEVVFSFILPQEAVSGIEAEALAVAAQRAAEVGEPWLSRLRGYELALRLRSMGFSHTIHLTPEQARERYFSNRRDGLKERRGEQLMRAIV